MNAFSSYRKVTNNTNDACALILSKAERHKLSVCINHSLVTRNSENIQKFNIKNYDNCHFNLIKIIRYFYQK